MMTFKIPAPVECQFFVNGVLQEKTIHFRDFVQELVLTQAYWRSTEDAATAGEEIFDELERTNEPVLRDSTCEKLQIQMRLADTTLITQNPYLARPSLRFVRAVNGARKVEEPAEAAQ